MKIEDLKTGMLLLMRDDTLRVVIGNMAISYNNGGLELKDLNFKDSNNCNNWTVKKIYAEPKRENAGGFGAGFDFWLKDKKFIDENYNPELLWEYKNFKYPMWFKSKVNKYVVKFTRLESGTVVVKGPEHFKIGYTCSAWCPHTDTSIWEPIENPNKLNDKDAIWCWDNMDTTGKSLKFWDVENNRPFSFFGRRSGCNYDYYEKIQPEDEPEWCKEARKHLED